MARPITHASAELVEMHLLAGRALRFTVPTTSMTPTLNAGDKVLVRGAQPDALRRGDIILARLGDAWLAHRLIRRHVEAAQVLLYTKGDNSVHADEPWPATNTLGIVYAMEIGGRVVSLQSRRATGLATITAWASWLQSNLYREGGGRVRVMIVTCLGISVHQLGFITRWLSARR